MGFLKFNGKAGVKGVLAFFFAGIGIIEPHLQGWQWQHSQTSSPRNTSIHIQERKSTCGYRYLCCASFLPAFLPS